MIGVLTSTDPFCNSQWGWASPGKRFMNLADASGGVKTSICDSDLQTALQNIRVRIQQYLSDYHLKQKPDVNTIRVQVDGRAVPQDAKNGWTYIDSLQVIRFNGTAIPKSDVLILIDYTLLQAG